MRILHLAPSQRCRAVGRPGCSRRCARLAAAGHADLAALGVNQLQTRLHVALQAEVWAHRLYVS